MFGVMHQRRQGDLGEFSALEWLGSQGYPVWLPFGHSPDVDLVARIDGCLVGVQVKTSTCMDKGRFVVTVCTRGGNRSWSGLVKRFSADRCDWLFVLVGDGRRWFIPAEAVEGGARILLGGPKYAAYEVAPGRGLSEALAA
jgi:Holliday junction resolvase-like predicted endonuclease